MSLKMLLFVSGAVFVCGCSSSPKKAPVGSPVTIVDAPVKTEVPAKVVAPKNEMTCKRGVEKRLLEVESLDPKGCKLWYSRYEIRNFVASSVLGNAYCEQVRENIRTKLVSAGFDCGDGQTGKAPIEKATAAATPAVAPATKAPTVAPTATPAVAPATKAPTVAPAATPAVAPATKAPTVAPTATPATKAPTVAPAVTPDSATTVVSPQKKVEPPKK